MKKELFFKFCFLNLFLLLICLAFSQKVKSLETSREKIYFNKNGDMILYQSSDQPLRYAYKYKYLYDTLSRVLEMKTFLFDTVLTEHLINTYCGSQIIRQDQLLLTKFGKEEKRVLYEYDSGGREILRLTISLPNKDTLLKDTFIYMIDTVIHIQEGESIVITKTVNDKKFTYENRLRVDNKVKDTLEYSITLSKMDDNGNPSEIRVWKKNRWNLNGVDAVSSDFFKENGYEILKKNEYVLDRYGNVIKNIMNINGVTFTSETTYNYW